MTSPIRVLCVTPYGVEGRGGIDRLYRYLREFHETGALAGVEMQYFAARGDAPGNLWVLAFAWRIILFIIHVARWRPHVVHLNFATGGSTYRKYVLLRLAHVFGAKTVVHFHGSFGDAELRSRSLNITCMRALCRRADLIVVLGAVYREAFIRFAGKPAGQVRIILNGIPDFANGMMLPKQPRNDVKLLFAGLVGEHKGIAILIEALRRLHDAAGAWTCVVAGDGEIARYAALATQSGVSAHFTDWVEADEVHRLMQECDVVVLPSRSEGLPLALIEGTCAGAALVATPVGEVAQVLHDGANGIIVHRDPATLAAAIGRLIANRDELARMQQESRRLFLEKFTVQAFAASLRALYLDIAAIRAA